jgi:hypothetical protein
MDACRWRPSVSLPRMLGAVAGTDLPIPRQFPLSPIAALHSPHLERLNLKHCERMSG